MSISQRLASLRHHMQGHHLDLYLVPTTDAHNSEYVPNCWQRREWISGFDGSAGEVLVSHAHAYLSTDGRYFLQAEQQLDPQHYTLLKQTGFAPATEDWLAIHAQGLRLGVDAQLLSIERERKLRQLMTSLGGELLMIDNNLVDSARMDAGEEFSLPQAPAFSLDLAYSGTSVAEKLKQVREQLSKQQVNYLVLNVLDEIAWLFNVRGADIDFNPLVISYAIISNKQALWFVDPNKVSGELRAALMASGIEVRPYGTLREYLSDINGKLWFDDKTASSWLLQQIKNPEQVYFARSPIVLFKAVKNQQEIKGVYQAHRKDAVAMIKFFYWLEHNWQTGVDEIQAADYLTQMRAAEANFYGPSFATISGYAANGAVIHYRATPATCKRIAADNLYLLDSGGQYLEGTTDITRTVHLGTPTAEQKRNYTLVLKGHLALSRAVFPAGTCGEHLDILARAPSWQAGLNYRHGTGHGVGSFLCVHEGPQRISSAPSAVPFVPGMIVSNEPGYYADGNYGIRIENLCLVTACQDPSLQASEYGPFYGFDDLTLVPYAKNLLDFNLLTDSELAQITQYYARIEREVAPLLPAAERAWLLEQLKISS